MLTVTASAAASLGYEPEVIVNSKFYFSFEVPRLWNGQYALKARNPAEQRVYYALEFNSNDGSHLLTITVAERNYASETDTPYGSLFGFNELYSYFALYDEDTHARLLEPMARLHDYLIILDAPADGYYVNKTYNFSIQLPEVWHKNPHIAFVDVEPRDKNERYILDARYEMLGQWYTMFSIVVLNKDAMYGSQNKYDQYLGQNNEYVYYYNGGDTDESHIPTSAREPLSRISQLFSERYLSPPIGCAILANLKPIKTSVVRQNGMTFVPLRAVCEAFGYDLSWEEETSSIIVSTAQNEVSIAVGEPHYHVGKASHSMSASPFLHNGITYVPQMFFSDALGLHVETTVAGEFIIQ